MHNIACSENTIRKRNIVHHMIQRTCDRGEAGWTKMSITWILTCGIGDLRGFGGVKNFKFCWHVLCVHANKRANEEQFFLTTAIKTTFLLRLLVGELYGQEIWSLAHPLLLFGKNTCQLGTTSNECAPLGGRSGAAASLLLTKTCGYSATSKTKTWKSRAATCVYATENGASRPYSHEALANLPCKLL